jgi:hypothetical protein
MALASTVSLLALVQFATLDRRPVVDAGENAPVAIFHDVKKIGLWR